MKQKRLLQDGISLLELMISMAIMGLIFTLLINSYLNISSNNEKLQKILENRQEFRILRDLITQDLQSVIYLKSYTKRKTEEDEQLPSGLIGINQTFALQLAEDSVLEAQGDIIHFHTHRTLLNQLPPTDIKDPELHEVSYLIELNEESSRLILSRREEFYIDSDMTSGERSIHLVLSEFVTGLNFRYLGENQTEWVEEWDSTTSNEIPVAIEIQLTFQPINGEPLSETFQINLRPPLADNIDWDL